MDRFGVTPMKLTNRLGASTSGMALALAASSTFAAGVPTDDLSEVQVTAVRHKLIGTVESSTQGTVTRTQLETRPVLRTGELLETVPGLVVTQHSGDGKANQYFMRGFNLDHGTDLATRHHIFLREPIARRRCTGRRSSFSPGGAANAAPDGRNALVAGNRSLRS
jgi:outer membrane receptor protein involved in Fe transport